MSGQETIGFLENPYCAITGLGPQGPMLAMQGNVKVVT